jgi:hypothetical protein
MFNGTQFLQISSYEEISNEINANSIVFQKISLMNFETYKSILPVQIIKPDIFTHIINYEESFLAMKNPILQDLITIMFSQPMTMTKHVQFPESIVVGVARFGGILAALRGLMIVMNLINRKQFERKVKKFLHKENPKAEVLHEPTSIVNSSHAGDFYRRKTFNIQDEENIDRDNLVN